MNLSNKHLISFIIIFILLTPIGIITHELGHILVAKSLSYETTLHHSSLDWNNEVLKTLKNKYQKFKLQIEDNLPFEGHEQYKLNMKRVNKHHLLILLGGVVQTITFGLVAFIFLLYRNIIKKSTFTSLDWLLSFISLFWLREPANLILSVIKGFRLKNNIYFYGDEVKMANLLGLYEGAILLPLTIISIFISLYILRIIPNKRKKEFIIGALIGCPIGFFLWTFAIGPIILP